jgi:cytochrome b
MREQTRRNIHYLIGMAVLSRLAAQLGWDGKQMEAARAELVRRFAPTLVEI